MEGNGHIVFVAGEAGMGKTALLDEFARRAQKNHPNMVVAVGNCNAFSGIGDPYLPFRDILGMLTGDIESRWAAGSITRGQAQNLLDISPETFKAVLDEGIHLIDVLVPASSLLKRFASGSDSPDFEESRLRRLVERTSTQSADLEQRQIFEECTKVFQT